MTSEAAESAAASRGIEVVGLHRFTLKRADVNGLVLGFAAFDEGQIRKEILGLAAALQSRSVR